MAHHGIFLTQFELKTDGHDHQVSNMGLRTTLIDAQDEKSSAISACFTIEDEDTERVKIDRCSLRGYLIYF